MNHHAPTVRAFRAGPRNLARRALASFLFLLVPLLTLGVCAATAGENLIANPGFENGNAYWGSFIPQESLDKGCEFSVGKVSPHGGTTCAELKSSDFARFSIGPKELLGEPLRPGEHCRLTFWIRAGKDMQAKGQPSLIVRMFLLDDQGKSLASNMAVYVGTNGKTTVQSPENHLDLSGLGDEIPTAWTKVESVFEVPKNLDAARLGRPDIFATYTKGSLFLDDFVLERVPSSIPLSATSK